MRRGRQRQQEGGREAQSAAVQKPLPAQMQPGPGPAWRRGAGGAPAEVGGQGARERHGGERG